MAPKRRGAAKGSKKREAAAAASEVAEPQEATAGQGGTAAAGDNGHAELDKLVADLASRLDITPPRLSEASKHAEPAASADRSLQERELLGVLQQITGKAGSLRMAAQTMLEQFSPKGGPPTEGDAGKESGYMEVKVQLMLSYIICLVYYLLMKVRGAPVCDHPVVDRIMWIRTLLEKLRPVDQRLQYQMSKLLQWAEKRNEGGAAPDASSDPLALRPGELATGVEDSDDDGEDAAAMKAAKDDDGIYKPPRISSVEYTGDHLTEKDKAERHLEKQRQRLDRSDFVRSLREEFTDAPQEVRMEVRSAAAERAARKLAEKQEYEEDTMTRLRTSKSENRMTRRLLREGRASGGTVSLNDAVDFRELAGAISEGGRPGKGGKGRRKGGSGSVLRDYQEAAERAHKMRGVVDQTLGGFGGGGGGGKKRAGSAGGGGRGSGKKRKGGGAGGIFM